MRRSVGLLALILMMVGCSGKPDPLAPAREPLADDSEAVTEFDTRYGVPGNTDPSVVRIELRPGQRASTELSRFGFEDIPVGTRVKVIADPDSASKSFDREVEVRVLEGVLKGKIGTIPRQYLRTAESK